MAFTFQALEGVNSVTDAEISITLDPITAIFEETNWVAESTDTASINVANDNADVDVLYYISADWRASGTGAPEDARLMAERLNVVVTVEPEEGSPVSLYTGILADLIQQPTAGRELEGGADEDVQFVLSLPATVSHDLIQGMAIEFDLVFVAVADSGD